jgi:hypothetical protein
MTEQTWRAENSLKGVAAGGRHIRERLEGGYYRTVMKLVKLGRHTTHFREWLDAGISEKGWKAGITQQG